MSLAVHPTNAPRCDIQRCRNQAAGQWEVTPGRRIHLCQTCREDIARDLRRADGQLPGAWFPLLHDAEHAAIERRLRALAAGQL